MSLDILKSWFNEAARSGGLDAEFDEDGVCSLEISGEFPLSIAVSDADPDLFVIVALVAPLSGDPLSDLVLMKRAMALNRFQSETAGGTLARGPHMGAINYILAYPFEGADATLFGNILGNFIITARNLRKELLQGKDSDIPAPPESPGDGVPAHAIRV